VLGTLLLWVGFEFYHQTTDVDIPVKLRQESNNPLPNSFDADTLNSIYTKSKDKFYEPVDSQTNDTGVEQ
jgi:hypothetical protein